MRLDHAGADDVRALTEPDVVLERLGIRQHVLGAEHVELVVLAREAVDVPKHPHNIVVAHPALLLGGILGHAGLSQATGGRSKLVSNGVDLFLHHPLVGVGTGGFVASYQQETHLKGTPKAAASHDAPITVAAETGLPGIALLLWLLALVFTVPFRGNRGATPRERARLAFGLGLVAIVVHSLFYNALIEDPLFWGLIALSALALREPEPT